MAIGSVPTLCSEINATSPYVSGLHLLISFWMFLCQFLHVTVICRAGFVINGPRELIEKFSFSIFWKNLWSTDKIYSLSVWYNSPVKHHSGFRLLCIFLESSSKLSNLLILVVCNIPFNLFLIENRSDNYQGNFSYLSYFGDR